MDTKGRIVSSFKAKGMLISENRVTNITLKLQHPFKGYEKRKNKKCKQIICSCVNVKIITLRSCFISLAVLLAPAEIIIQYCRSNGIYSLSIRRGVLISASTGQIRGFQYSPFSCNSECIQFVCQLRVISLAYLCWLHKSAVVCH